MNQKTVFATASLIIAFWFQQNVMADESVDELLRLAQKATANGQHADAVTALDKAIKQSPKESTLYYMRGRANFRAAKIGQSVSDFDKHVELSPELASRQWERGITLYYAGEFEKGAKQFELYQTFHDQDVENSTWRFLCMARQPEVGVAKARSVMLPISRDPRIPMMEIFELYRGKSSPEKVLAAANEDQPLPEILAGRLFYTHLYLGLHYEATNETELAKKYLLLAAADNLKTNSRINGYMWDVARVHVLLRKWRD